MNFKPDRLYRTDDPALQVIATQGTLGQWRFRGYGPPYIRFGNRILYRGSDLNAWLNAHIVEPQDRATA